MAKMCRRYVPEQDLLLPPSLRDSLPEGHLAFFVSHLIDQLDLSAITAAIGFTVVPSSLRRPRSRRVRL